MQIAYLERTNNSHEQRGIYVRIEKMEVKTIPVVEYDYGFRTR